MKRAAVFLIAVLALCAAPAAAKPHHRFYVPRHGQRCHRDYVRRHRKMKRHGHVRRVRICVKRRHRAAAEAPAPKVVKLHAHLDPTFTRDPSDPFKVTYSFSASATQEASGAVTASLVEEPAPLPSGVVAFYSDGKLECAVNVGGASTGSKCPVHYEALGNHEVTTIYSSGEQSATETETENIGPLATTTTLTVSYEPLANSGDTFGCGPGSTCLVEEGWHESGGFEIGTLRVRGSTSLGDQPVSACTDSACKPVTLDANGEASFPVSVIADWIANEERVVEVGETIELETEAMKHVYVGEFPGLTVAEVESGAVYFRVASPARAGYIGSEATAAIKFTPAVVEPVERIPNP